MSWSLLGMSFISSTSNVTATTARIYMVSESTTTNQFRCSHRVRRKRSALWLEAVRGLGVLLPDSTDYADLAYAIAYWRRRSTTRAGATSAQNANATSDAYPWINDKARAPIEKELIEAFKAEVIGRCAGLIWLLTSEKFPVRP